MTTVMERVAAGELVVIDGGTGTEIQRRGGAMDDATWCAEANLQRPDLVRDVHRAYLEAGAELIIANTFATSPLLFATLGRDDEVASIDRAAVRLAREACAGGGAAVAGSISTMQPVLAGDDRTDRSRTWTEAEVRERYRRKAGTLAEAGVDVLVMEMMRDTGPSVWATEAAMETGLPVWVGLSFEPGPDGGLVGWGRPESAMDDVIAALDRHRPRPRGRHAHLGRRHRTRARRGALAVRRAARCLPRERPVRHARLGLRRRDRRRRAGGRHPDLDRPGRDRRRRLLRRQPGAHRRPGRRAARLTSIAPARPGRPGLQSDSVVGPP